MDTKQKDTLKNLFVAAAIVIIGGGILLAMAFCTFGWPF